MNLSRGQGTAFRSFRRLITILSNILKNMNNSKNKKDKSTSALLSAIEKLGAIGAVATIIVLIGAYYWIASTAPDEEYLQHTRDLCLSLLTGIIPVFVLFVLSYALLREINEHRELEKHESFAKAVSNNILDSIQVPVPDKFFSRKTGEYSLIEQAIEEIWFVQETGSLISEAYRSEIISFLQRSGKIKVIVVDPSKTISSLMVLRNSTLRTIDSFQSRSQKFIDHLFEIAKTSGGTHDQIEVRYLSYPISYTMVMADPNSSIERNSKALVRIAGFKVPYEDKADFSLCLATSPDNFKSYREQFLQMWACSSRFTLIAGSPKSGKTTLMEDLVKKFDGVATYFVLSKEIVDEANTRIGFEVVTSISNIPRKFSTRNDNGEYTVDISVWDEIANDIQLSMKSGISLFLIDELGPMQLKSLDFCNSIDSLLKLYSATVYMTVANDSLFAQNSLGINIKRNPRTALVTLSQENREQIRNQLYTDISQQ